MTILGIDTSSGRCGAALIREGVIAASRAVEIPRSHDEKVLLMIDECLKEAGSGPEKLDGVAVSSGPGSFTGLRIGFSTAKGICAATGSAFLPVPTFEAWALRAARRTGAPDGRVFLAMMMAGAGEVYAGSYRYASGGIAALSAARLYPAGEIGPFASCVGGHVVVAERPDEALRVLPETDRDAIFSPASGDGSAADEVALLGWRRLRAGERGDISTAVPMYLKEFSYKLPVKKGD